MRDVTIISSTPNSQGGATTAITATVFLPETHNQGASYPLIIHAHGWAASRISKTDADNLEPGGAGSASGPGYIRLIASQVRALREAGYAVISYDHRGFGRGDDGDHGTEDGAHGMSPDFEVEDAKAVIDWALQNLNLILDAPEDPRLGLIGASYGGALQVMLAAEDPRVDAIVPATTWFNLAQALAPNRVLKKGWAIAICAQAVLVDNAELAAEIQAACNEVNEPGNRELGDTPVAENIFFDNGLSAYAGQPGFAMPEVDALILQGNRDILFNQNQGEALLEFLSSGGGDVKLLLHEAGHSLRVIRNGPGSQGPLGHGFCGSIDTVLLIREWLDWRLRGGSPVELPTICLALDDHSAVHLTELPRGSADHRITIPTTIVTGTGEHNDLSAADEALFFPLTAPISNDSTILAGVPVARLSVDAEPGNSDPTPTTGPNAAGVFVGIGIRRGTDMLLVDDQVQPLLSSDDRTGMMPDPIELVGVGELLEVGDEVGVLLYGRHDQYENHTTTGPETGTNWRGNMARVSGTVDLPIRAAGAIDSR